MPASRLSREELPKQMRFTAGAVVCRRATCVCTSAWAQPQKSIALKSAGLQAPLKTYTILLQISSTQCWKVMGSFPPRRLDQRSARTSRRLLNERILVAFYFSYLLDSLFVQRSRAFVSLESAADLMGCA